MKAKNYLLRIISYKFKAPEINSQDNFATVILPTIILAISSQNKDLVQILNFNSIMYII